MCLGIQVIPGTSRQYSWSTCHVSTYLLVAVGNTKILGIPLRDP